MLWNLFQFVRSVRQKQWETGLQEQKYGLFVDLVFSAYFAIIFIYSVVLEIKSTSTPAQ